MMLAWTAVLFFGLPFLGLPFAMASTSQPSTKFVVKVTSKPSTQPTSKALPPFFAKPWMPTTLPKRFGKLTISLPPNYRVWLNGHDVGRLPVWGLRLGSGKVFVTLWNQINRKRQDFALDIPASKHLWLMKKRNKVGAIVARFERTDVLVQRQTKKGTQEEFWFPQIFCLAVGNCPFLFPGDKLYLHPYRPSLLLPSQEAIRAKHGYRAKKEDGFLSLHSFPTGILKVDGKVIWKTPVSRLPLSAGIHKIQVLNHLFQLTFEKKIHIVSGKNTRLPVFLKNQKVQWIQVISKQPQMLWSNGYWKGWTSLRFFHPVGKTTLESRDIRGKKHFKQAMLQANQPLVWKID